MKRASDCPVLAFVGWSLGQLNVVRHSARGRIYLAVDEAHVELGFRQSTMGWNALIDRPGVGIDVGAGLGAVLTTDRDIFDGIVVVVSDCEIQHHDTVKPAFCPVVGGYRDFSILASSNSRRRRAGMP